MYCTSCGVKRTDGDKFCRECGAKFADVGYSAPAGQLEAGQQYAATPEYAAPTAEPKKESKPKKILKAIGIALGSFAIMEAWQFAVTFVYMFIVAFKTGFTAGLSGAELSFTEMQNMIAGELASSINIILIIADVLTLLTFFIIFKVRKKKPLAAVHFTKASPKHILLATAMGASLQLVVAVAITFASTFLPPSFVEPLEGNSILTDSSPLWLTILSVAIVTPILEETVFRGIIHSSLSPAMPKAVAVIISSAIFGIAHGSVVAFIYAGAFGVLLALLLEKTGSIIPGIFAHFAFNLAAILLEYVMPENILLIIVIFFAAAAATVASTYFALKKDNTDERIINNEAV